MKSYVFYFIFQNIKHIFWSLLYAQKSYFERVVYYSKEIIINNIHDKSNTCQMNSKINYYILSYGWIVTDDGYEINNELITFYLNIKNENNNIFVIVA